LGIGILTATTIRDFAIRIHEPFYRKVLEAELTTRNINHGYIANGAPLEPLPSLNFREKLTDLVEAKISPVFATLGKMYIYTVSTFAQWTIYYLKTSGSIYINFKSCYQFYKTENCSVSKTIRKLT
jgi:hypothetical protein